LSALFATPPESAASPPDATQREAFGLDVVDGQTYDEKRPGCREILCNPAATKG